MDMLLSADLLVADAGAALATLVDTIGIDEPRPSWQQLWPGYGFEAWWCRVGRDLSASPTRLEIISPHGDVDPALAHPYMREIWDAQGDRPAKAHSTPIAVPDVGALADQLTSRGARFRLDPVIEELPFLRLWMGMTADEPTTYLPVSDGGLRLEFVVTDGLGMPAGAAAPDPVPPPGAGDGAFVGVAARLFVTADLAGTIDVLHELFEWDPVEVIDGRATFGFEWARSAVIEVVEPVPDSLEAAVLAGWGTGPYGIRLRVDGLDAKTEDLVSRGTPFEIVERASGEVILIDPATTCGTPFELVEA